MRPILFTLPLPGGLEISLPAYGTFLVLGMLAAVWVSGRHAPLLGLQRRQVFDLGIFLVFLGLVGAHLLDVALHPQLYFADGLTAGLWEAIAFWRGGLVYYGGLVTGMAGCLAYARDHGIPVADMLDFVAPLGSLALGSTRVGCFLNGCCYGVPTAWPLAIVYPAASLAQSKQAALGLVPSDAPSLPIHPVQLYELVAALLVFWLLWRRFPRRRFAGEVVAAFFLIYGSWRFAIEFLRADAPTWRPTGGFPLSEYQWLSLAVVAGAIVAWIVAARVSRAPWYAARPRYHEAGEGEVA